VAAVEGLRRLGELLTASSIWVTAPVGGPPQGEYLNAVVTMHTVLGPRPLLEGCLDIERESGRERRERWGPRVLDLDLLLYEDAVIDTAGLRIPHPRLHERRFALAPLAEAWPGVAVPGHGPVEDLLQSVSGQAATVLGDVPPGWPDRQPDGSVR